MEKEESIQRIPLAKREFVLNHHIEGEKKYNFISCYFREGTLLILIPSDVLLDPIMDVLLGRERVVRDLMLNKMPSFVPFVCSWLIYRTLSKFPLIFLRRNILNWCLRSA